MEAHRMSLLTWGTAREATETRREYAAKRVFDALLSTAGLVVSAPVFGAIALAIKLEDGGRVFYTQERVGQYGKPFRLYKFRSMVEDAESTSGPTWASKHDPRITRVGRLLRRTAGDELPQLINIVRGDISFVGPRSHRAFFADKFSREVPGYAARYAARPGLTGLAQVFGRYDSSAKQKLRFDLLYLRHRSLALDVKLILVSFLVSFLGRWDERGGAKVRGLKRFMRLGVSDANEAPRLCRGALPRPAKRENADPARW
jgi:lipopolysaccharide/colanic/teichoic acid biosynthesis glycosyltransferase